ncbi:flagella [Thermococcus sp. 21S9]|uniref:flagella n=1 Tax=Thermococcus sp. 21S9 TaxID=1638223 RepID=UPI00143C05D4|nr:flagella [Thermococcus sp. 21S9]NJE53913.1 flagella [Thermococcus sp. 21S9]
MGFSVSASAAIIFISFLMVAGTLYTAWDNAYSNVQAAQEYWYNLRLNQLNTLSALNGGLSSFRNTSTYYNLTLAIDNQGVTMYAPHWTGIYDGKYVTLYNIKDDNVSFLDDYTYVLPGQHVLLNVTYIPLNSDVHNLSVIFGDGCWIRFTWHYDSANHAVYVSESRGCPTEVS